jgi:pyrroloquinoline-quinone synthase
MTTEKTLRALDDFIRQRSILQHAFYRAWQRGELASDQLAIYSRVYYPHVAAFPRYLRNAINCTGDSVIRSVLEQNLEDELTNPAPHPELWLDFAAATGQDKETIECAEPVPKTADSIATFDRFIPTKHSSRK